MLQWDCNISNFYHVIRGTYVLGVLKKLIYFNSFTELLNKSLAQALSRYDVGNFICLIFGFTFLTTFTLCQKYYPISRNKDRISSSLNPIAFWFSSLDRYSRFTKVFSLDKRPFLIEPNLIQRHDVSVCWKDFLFFMIVQEWQSRGLKLD